MKKIEKILAILVFSFINVVWAGSVKQIIKPGLKSETKRFHRSVLERTRTSALSIEDMNCRSCVLQIIIRNLGSAGVSSDDYRNGRLEIKVNGDLISFPLTQVDPGKALSRPGGSVCFTTKIVCRRMTVIAQLKGLKHDGPGGKKTLKGSFIPHPKCKARRKKPSFNLPFRLVEKNKGCERKLKDLRNILNGLLSSQTIREQQVRSFYSGISDYVSIIKKAFELAMEEVRKGNPRALLEFESLVKKHQEEIKAMLSQAQTLEEKIRNGRILPEKRWLEHLSSGQRKAFLNRLTPEGQNIIKKAYPGLFFEKGAFRRFLEDLFFLKTAEAKIFEPCLEPCNVTMGEAFNIVGSEQAREEFWERASQECKNCVSAGAPQAYLALKDFESCRSKCKGSSDATSILFSFFCHLQCLFNLLGALA